MTALDDLGLRIWAWRDATAFRSADDIPRIPHAPSWTPDFSAAAASAALEQLAAFRAELDAVEVDSEDVAAQVDRRLLASTLARAEWDWTVLRSWEIDANFLVSQLVGPYFDLLLALPPFAAERQAGLVAVLRAIPAQSLVARANLQRAGVRNLVAPGLHALDAIDVRLAESVAALQGFLEPETHTELVAAAGVAGVALLEFAGWLAAAGEGFAEPTVLGRERFVWYLRNVALIPDEPESLVAAAEQEYRRAVVWEAIGKNRRPDELPILPDVATQVERQRDDEHAWRDFYEQHGLLSQDGFGHYYIKPVPAYLVPLRWFGVNDDLTDATRLDIDGHNFAPDPSADLPYFNAANARDPRLGIIHEGAHLQQLVRAWSHEDPIRRHFYDSVSNEGIAFYNEEMLLQAGLFDDSPWSQNVVHNFNRLRSLRVLVDINLATGGYTIDQAIATFVARVPMDRETAAEETAMYIATPGLAMSYLVGKLQLMSMLADALERQGEEFSFRDFHDWVWRNGNVPFSLQRWELLGDRSAVDALDAWTAAHPALP